VNYHTGEGFPLKRIKSRLHKARTTLKQKDTGIDPISINTIEQGIRQRLTEDDLRGFNIDLKSTMVEPLSCPWLVTDACPRC
jgi:hypothetical protein